MEEDELLAIAVEVTKHIFMNGIGAGCFGLYMFGRITLYKLSDLTA